MNREEWEKTIAGMVERIGELDKKEVLGTTELVEIEMMISELERLIRRKT